MKTIKQVQSIFNKEVNISKCLLVTTKSSTIISNNVITGKETVDLLEKAYAAKKNIERSINELELALEDGGITNRINYMKSTLEGNEISNPTDPEAYKKEMQELIIERDRDYPHLANL